MKAAPFILRLLSLIVAAQTLPQSARAAQLMLGVSGIYNSHSLYATDGGSTSVYRGIGGSADLRYRVQATDWGVDLFTGVAISKEPNTSFTNETLSLTTVQFGIDFFYHVFFVGMQYSTGTGNLRGGVVEFDLDLGGFVARGGLQLPFKKFSIQIGGTYGKTATFLGGTTRAYSRVDSVQGFLGFQIPLMQGK